ncbi:hypothetical protein ABEX55_23075 [Priestia endophytica]|uniref:hypothetical protein n=1 Tax=Priestia endophytica TaxID=135735 RepID=UPI003D265243
MSIILIYGGAIGGSMKSNISGIDPSIGSLYDRLQVAQFDNIFNVLPAYGVSALRDVVTTSGNGSVSNTNGNGYILTTTSSANDSAILDTAERGRFNSGTAFETGVAIQIPSPPTGNQRIIWGIFDNDNGLYFGQDSGGLFIATRRNGNENVKVYQSQWNIDKLDGTGPSKLTLELGNGYMYQIRFGSNYGIAEYRILIVDPTNNLEKLITCHRQSTISQPIVGDPNQPVRVQIQNGATAQSLTANVRGRYYANLGTAKPLNRMTSERRLNVSTNNTTFVPLVSFQRKTTFPSGATKSNSINVTVNGFDLIASADVVWQLRQGSTLTGATWVNPSETLSNETCCFADTSATAINVSTGVKIMGGLAASGNRAALTSFPVDIVMTGSNPVTLCVRNVTSNTGTVSAVLRVHEEW